MDNPASKSEPAAPQEQQQSQDVQMLKRSKHKRVNSDSTERPASAQRDRRDDSIEHSDVEAGPDLVDEDADPADPIVVFDWQDLHVRYHQAINRCSQEEAELMNEWSSLMETEEDELERKRLHYINVVKAFESALNLLKANNAMMFRG
ncbi:hypothetical protein N0V87_006170 [Didymella glomerata]|uniref:Uncharacterized protein n=1 Tax=Didymella glomerata TaxID=749621 RepID=A0A9W9BZ19_9PLEO|nr:hypothetical protein N0V87_006170 [Didymella glomerata]